jgi:hypothetical protein
VEYNLIAKDERTVQDGEGHMGDIAIDNGEAGYEAMGMIMVVMMMVMTVVMLVMMVIVVTVMMIMMLVMLVMVLMIVL